MSNHNSSFIKVFSQTNMTFCPDPQKRSTKVSHIDLDKTLLFAPSKTKVDNLGKKKYMRDAKMLGKLSKENSALTFEGNQQFVRAM